MHLTSILLFATSTVAAALPTDGYKKGDKACGVAYVQAPASLFFRIPRNSECHDMGYIIDAVDNYNCGLCKWYEGHNCEADGLLRDTTANVGYTKYTKIAPSKSVRCDPWA